MNDYKSLKVLDKFKAVFEKFGVNYNVMRKIVQIQLTLDDRQTPTAFISNDKKNREENRNFSKVLLLYLVIGGLCSMVIFTKLPIFLKMSLILGIIIFMVTTTFISDFSSVLLDIKYKNILVPKPIDIKTINVAKIVHIFIYMFLITMAFAGPSIIACAAKHGILFAFIFFLEIILIDLMCILFTSLLYMAILYFFDGEKLKDIINYFQIFLSILLTFGYQFLGRLFDALDINLSFTLKWQHGFLPSTWFASLLSLINERNFETLNIVFSIFAIVIPLLSIFIYFKFIITYFENNLQKLMNNYSKKSNKAERTLNRNRKIASLFCSNNIESSTFIFTKNMCSNERNFKLRLYPGLAFYLAFPFIILLPFIREATSFSQVSNEIASGNLYLVLYFLVIFLPLDLVLITQSSKHKAAWIYRILPIKTPAPLLKGAFKSFSFYYIYSTFIFDSVLFLMLGKFNLHLLFNIIIMFLNLSLINIITFKNLKKALPFSLEFTTNGPKNILLCILIMCLGGLLAFIHFATKFLKHGILLYGVVLLFLNIYLWRKKLNVSWKELL